MRQGGDSFVSLARGDFGCRSVTSCRSYGKDSLLRTIQFTHSFTSFAPSGSFHLGKDYDIYSFFDPYRHYCHLSLLSRRKKREPNSG